MYIYKNTDTDIWKELNRKQAPGHIYFYKYIFGWRNKTKTRWQFDVLSSNVAFIESIVGLIFEDTTVESIRKTAKSFSPNGQAIKALPPPPPRAK